MRDQFVSLKANSGTLNMYNINLHLQTWLSEKKNAEIIKFGSMWEDLYLDLKQATGS